MKTREKKFLLGGIGAGMLGAALIMGAFAGQHEHHAPTLPPATTGQTSSESLHGNAGAPTSSTAPSPSIQLSPEEVSAAGVQLAEVTRAKLETSVDAFGRVEQPEAQLSSVSARVSGRIDKLYVQYTGERVGRGQAVASIYSPDAAAALDEYRLAVKSRESLGGASQEAREQANDLVNASRRRLELWDISDKRIENPNSNDVHITMYSPTSGTVVERKIARGQYVKEGDTLFTLADLSTVWVKAEVYESQLPQIRAGQTVELRSDSLPDQVIHGKVEFIEPNADPQTRTIPVHVHVPNPGMRLVPGMYVRAVFTSRAARESLVVPRSAVLDTGTRTLVYVASGNGTFAARDVEVGAASGELYPLLRGLKLGEKVVTNGNFLIDSQTRLSGGMTGLYGGSKEFQKNAAPATPGAAPASTQAKVSLAVEPNPPKGASEAMFHVSLFDASGKAIPDAKVQVTLVMPAMPSMNMPEMRNSFDLPWSGGMYMGNGNVPMSGSWNVTVEATKEGQVVASYRTRLTAK